MSIDALALMLAFGSSVAGFTAHSHVTQPLHTTRSKQDSSSSFLSGTASDDWFPYSGSVRPGRQSPQRTVPADRLLPNYAHDGVPKDNRSPLPWVITPKTPKEIQKMRASGKLARKILDLAGRSVGVGVTTDEIDVIVHDAIVEAGAYPSPLNYHNFPKSLCTSVNEIICHGIPDDRRLQEGDIINLDVTVYLDGFHGDCSEMFLVGPPNAATKKLLQTTYDAWLSACQMVHSGVKYQEIGAVIDMYATRNGFASVPGVVGHGIGRIFHDTPDVHHVKNKHNNGQMAVGHTFTIEPMICEGTAKFIEWDDDWTLATADGKRSAQFEHTLLVTEDGVEALTGKNEDSMVQFWEKESNIHQGIWLGTSEAAKKKADALNAKIFK